MVKQYTMSDNTSDLKTNYMDDDEYKDDDGTITISRSNFYLVTLGIFLLFLFGILLIMFKKNRVYSEPKCTTYHTACTMIMDPNTVYVPELCSICLSIYTEDEMITTLKCGHSFHKECISEWYTISTSEAENEIANCPCCNEEFTLTPDPPQSIAIPSVELRRRPSFGVGLF